MGHIAIFYVIANLVVGTWAVVYTHQIAKSHRYPFLQPIGHYTIFYNLCIFSILIVLYKSINLPENFLQDKIPFYEDIYYLFLTLVLIGMLVSMLRIDSGFLGKDLSIRTNRWIAAFIILLILSYGLKILLRNQSVFIRWLDTIHSSIWNNILVLEIPILIVMLIHSNKDQDRGRGRISRTFAWFYLLRYASILILLPFLLAPRPVRLLIGMGLFITFNIIPYFWSKYFFLAYAESMSKFIEEKGGLESLYQKYNISRREKEILKLILDGKSNKEIEDTLFISYHTVKNHIYNLYQKLGVKTRYELVHMMTKLQTGDY